MAPLTYNPPSADYQPKGPYRVCVTEGDRDVFHERTLWLYDAVRHFARFLPPQRDTIVVILDTTMTAVLIYWGDMDGNDAWWQGCDVGFTSLARVIEPELAQWYKVMAAYSLPDARRH